MGKLGRRYAECVSAEAQFDLTLHGGEWDAPLAVPGADESGAGYFAPLAHSPDGGITPSIHSGGLFSGDPVRLTHGDLIPLPLLEVSVAAGGSFRANISALSGLWKLGTAQNVHRPSFTERGRSRVSAFPTNTEGLHYMTKTAKAESECADEFGTVTQAIEITGKSRWTIYHMIQRGDLQAINTGFGAKNPIYHVNLSQLRRIMAERQHVSA